MFSSPSIPLPSFLLSRNSRRSSSSSIPPWNRPPMRARSGILLRRRTSFFLQPSLSMRAHDEASQPPANGDELDSFGGWSAVASEVADGKTNFALIGSFGASIAIAVAAIAAISFTRKGIDFRIRDPFRALHHEWGDAHEVSTELQIADQVNEELNVDVALEAVKSASENMENDSQVLSASRGNKNKISHFLEDTIQQEALSFLKELQIVERDANGDDLCTRRDYARWLVKASSMLERNPRQRIVSSMSLAGSLVLAFDDVGVSDPDFLYIQALGETGIVPSKLVPQISCPSNTSDTLYGGQDSNFFPESYISRFDLLNWKVLLEYSSFSVEEKVLRSQMSMKDIGFLDLRMSKLDTTQLASDLMAGGKSITSRVFGNIRRLQPHRPATKAQAAVAISSGRMQELIHSELARLESESLSRSAESQEIKTELLRKGEIQRPWLELLEEETARGVATERDLSAALLDLEAENAAWWEYLPSLLKEKADLDCQQQLVKSLEQEVDGMREKLSIERADLLAEQNTLDSLFHDMCEKSESISKAKSILDAEKEALQTTRYRVEDEARRIGLQTKLLEEARRRWMWNEERSLPQPSPPRGSDGKESIS